MCAYAGMVVGTGVGASRRGSGLGGRVWACGSKFLIWAFIKFLVFSFGFSVFSFQFFLFFVLSFSVWIFQSL